MEPKVTPCAQQDLDKLAKQQDFALQRLQQLVGYCTFTGEAQDLSLIQQGLDTGELDHKVDLQCLGVPFGQVLINYYEGFDWWMLEDHLGVTPCIRYRESNLLIFPITLISKRVEQGEAVDVPDLFADLLAQIEPLRQQLDIQLHSSSSEIH